VASLQDHFDVREKKFVESTQFDYVLIERDFTDILVKIDLASGKSTRIAEFYDSQGEAQRVVDFLNGK